MMPSNLIHPLSADDQSVAVDRRLADRRLSRQPAHDEARARRQVRRTTATKRFSLAWLFRYETTGSPAPGSAPWRP